MFLIKYISEGGTVEMGGGSAPHFNVTSISGFELPGMDFTEKEFAGENGSTLTGKKDTSRTLTVSGTVRGTQETIEQAYKAFYHSGELHCIFGNKRRKILCRCSRMDDMERLGNSNLSKFVVQFKADYPYFSDINKIVVPIYKLTNLVTDSFELPCVFTKRETESDLFNTGDKDVYPTIIIKNSSSNSAVIKGMQINNTVTGAFIKLDYALSAGETVTLNLDTRKIRSDINGNITNYISDDTDLSLFCLKPGRNHLQFIGQDTSIIINASVVFSPLYLTAVR